MLMNTQINKAFLILWARQVKIEISAKIKDTEYIGKRIDFALTKPLLFTCTLLKRGQRLRLDFTVFHDLLSWV